MAQSSRQIVSIGILEGLVELVTGEGPGCSLGPLEELLEAALLQPGHLLHPLLGCRLFCQPLAQ